MKTIKAKNIQVSGLVVALIMLALYLAMFVGGTYAWFSDSGQSTGNSIQAGTLDMQLELVSGVDRSIKHSDGTQQSVNATPFTFVDGNNNPLIELTDANQPGDNGNRMMKITNNGDVAFSNLFSISITDSDTTDALVPADFVTIEIWQNGGKLTANAGEYDLGNCTEAGSVDFEIRYIINNVGNAYQGFACEVTFSLECEQLVAATA